MRRRPRIVRRADRARDPGGRSDHVAGRDIDTGVTVLLVSMDEPGRGAGLHVHPYDEVFVMREGRALYTIGGESFEAGPGDVLMGPANVPHKFVNLGPGRLQAVDIHLSDRWIQTDLDDPEV